MSQALHTSSTGINSGQQQINVIAHNVANINTTAYKSANLTFETLHSRNLSYGSAATKDGGGTNPKQIGLGVKVGGITRNFTPGSFVSTGRNLDTMISGNGFYVVKDANGGNYFTRDGVFSVDSAGNLVTQSGMKVMAAKSVYSNAGSDKTVAIPKNLLAKVQGDPNVGSRTLSSLINASITEGNVSVLVTKTTSETIDNGDGTSTKTTTIAGATGTTVITEIIDNTTGEVTDTEEETNDTPTFGPFPVTIPGKDGTVSQIVAAFNGVEGMTATDNGDGTISYSAQDGYDISFSPDGTTSNFLAESGWIYSTTSNPLNNIVALQDVVNYNSSDTISLSDVAIDEKGFVVATYNDGSILTQYVDETDAILWKFMTPDGVTITGADVTPEGSAIQNASFAIELATMVNQEGLISTSNNLWKWGPDAGDIYYGMAGEMAFGSIESGGYEESNVDIASELSNMIMAQRMIQMNSRVFSSASEVMQTLVYLGQ